MKNYKDKQSGPHRYGAWSSLRTMRALILLALATVAVVILVFVNI